MPISLNNVAIALQMPATTMVSIRDVYGSSQLAGTLDSGCYHNLAIGYSSLNFAAAIEAPYSGGADMLLSNWAGYDHDAINVVSFTVTNTSPNDYLVAFEISPSPVFGAGIMFYSFAVPASTVDNQPNYGTNAPSFTFTGTPGNEYFINCDIRLLSGSGFAVMVLNAVYDTDGVGAGTTRTDYTSANGPYVLEPVGPIFQDNLISGAGGWQRSPAIEWNKRTSWDMVIQ